MTAFGAKTSADEVVAGQDLSGKVVIVTGANTGIGFETARALASANARVIFACRSELTGKAAVAKALEMHPGCRVEFLPLDLASAASIIKFAELLPDEKIDMLICNAGLIATRYEQTEEGLEKTVGICHYGHFLLTKLIMPRLIKSCSPRVVMVSSESHRSPKVLDFDRFPLTRENYSMMVAYGQAKLANVLMANELQRRYGAQGLTACSLHPGTLITTDIGRQAMWMRIVMMIISPFTKSPNQGAATSVYCATEADPLKLAGHYFQDCQPARMSREAQNIEVAGKLWDVSEIWADQILSSQA